ncbi:MAG: hypothetical protein P8K68_08665 [Algibacter sp.]|uniref:hypothetical protein n=1 Tax=Algibacter sp. TaxID=1872428 RepID=UPI00260E72E9|nr:hypothetical protein [Algibacter sp.]MDG1730365.1 hypothetical protein [Algibacter sp.]MDG2178843.1 hypothetical protein [Algibacter sp.]
MNTKTGFPKPYILFLPLIGMGLFLFLYILAALNYPGGSWAFTNQSGFSFWHNYLCDLLDDYAINGKVNSARFFARAALGVLCSSIFFIWFFLPKLYTIKSINLIIMRLSGLLSLIITLFLASGTHDLIVRIAGIFGVIAVITCLVELYKAKYYKLLMLGVFCLIVFFVNFFIYETGYHIKILPVLQKITFISFIVWFVFLDIQLYKKLKFYNI